MYHFNEPVYRSLAIDEPVMRSVDVARPSVHKGFGPPAGGFGAPSKSFGFADQQSSHFNFEFSGFGMKQPSLSERSMSTPVQSTKGGFLSAMAPPSLFSQHSEELSDMETQQQNVVYVAPGAEPRMEPTPDDDLFRLELTNFRINRTDLTSCCDELSTWLLDNSVDYTFDQDMFEFKCKGYDRGCSVEFHVTVFGSLNPPSDSLREYIIEFQRRQGDCMQFGHLFQAARGHMTSDEIESVQNFDPLPMPVDFEMPDMPAGQEPAPAGPSGIASLAKMAGSEFADVHYEGLRGLARLSYEGHAIPLINKGTSEADSDLVLEALIKALPSAHEEAHRCAVTALANLCEGKASSDIALRRVLERGGLKRITELVLRSSTLEVLREAGRCLNTLASHETASEGDLRALRHAAGKLQEQRDIVVRSQGKTLFDRLCAMPMPRAASPQIPVY